MKKLVLFLLLILCHQNIIAHLGNWDEGGVIELSPDESCTYRYVQAMDADSKEILKNLFDSMSKLKAPSIRKIANDRYYVHKDYALPKGNYYESPIYKGDIITVLPRIVVSLKEGYQIDGILEHLGSKVKVERSEVEFRGGKRYYLACQMNKSEEVLKAVMSISGLVENEGIRYFEPEMYMKFTHCNTYYSQQYYLHNTNPNCVDINVVPAWAITSGSSSITVAVVDCGVERNHEDLTGRVLNGYTIGYPTSYGEPVNDVYSKKYHGTSVAGIIAANNNSIGIRGIAWSVKILPVNIIPGEYDMFGTNLQIADAIRWAYPYSDVINCSWGGGASSNDIDSALDEAMYNGRNGKGCVVVAAAGNNGNASNVAYPARHNGVIAVGAVHQNGSIWNYSQTGSSMCLVAPSGAVNGQGDVVTTDRMAPKGKNSNSNYNFTFGGTSAAAPQIAGVAALMLSVNPNLTRAQVKSKLESTATDLGTYGFDTTYGYGLVNAYQAVLSALPSNNNGNTFVSTTRSNTPQGYWTDDVFIELTPDESYTYRYVQTMDAESQVVLDNLLADKGDESVLKFLENSYFVFKDIDLPDGFYYESPIYKSSEGEIICVLPRIVISMKDGNEIDGVLGQLGSNVTVERSETAIDGGNRYYLTCKMKTSEEVLEAIQIISDLVESEGINWFEPEIYFLDMSMADKLTGISSLEHNTIKEHGRYSLDGRNLKSPAKGINIIRQTDGTTKKVIVK